MNPIYVVLIINLIVWTGIFGYIVYLNKEVVRLKKEVQKVTEE